MTGSPAVVTPAGPAARPVHPGRPLLPRRLALRATGVRERVETLATGEDIFAFARRVAAGFGGCAALLDFDAIAMLAVAIHVPEPDPSGRQIMRYGPAVVIGAPCALLSGQMSIGQGPDGPLLHAHGQVRRADGRRFGGHLSSGGCIAAQAAPVRCTVFEGMRLAPAFDPETGFDLLAPLALDAAQVPRGPGWLLRLKPDEDLLEALADLARVHGIAAPRVVGGVGSLMHATLATAAGKSVRIDGPGIEVVTLRGGPGGLRLVVADLTGAVHEGTPVAGGNPVCVTIELFVTEAP